RGHCNRGSRRLAPEPSREGDVHNNLRHEEPEDGIQDDSWHGEWADFQPVRARTAAASFRAKLPRRSTKTESNPNQAAIVHNSAPNASATAPGSVPVSTYDAGASNRRAARSALRSTRATRRSPSRNGST